MNNECPTGKRQYNTEEKAHKFRRYTALGNIKKGRIGSADRVLNVYKCRRCNQWHVGHSLIGDQDGRDNNPILAEGRTTAGGMGDNE